MALAAVICIKNASLHFWTEVNNIAAFSASGFPLKVFRLPDDNTIGPPPGRPNGLQRWHQRYKARGTSCDCGWEHSLSSAPRKNGKPVIGCGNEWHIRGLTLYVAVCYDITMIQHWNYHVCHMLLYVAVSTMYVYIYICIYHCDSELEWSLVCCWTVVSLLLLQWRVFITKPICSTRTPSFGAILCCNLLLSHFNHLKIQENTLKWLSSWKSPVQPHLPLWPYIILRCQVTSLGSGQLMVFFPHGQAVPSLTHWVEKPVTTPFLS